MSWNIDETPYPGPDVDDTQVLAATPLMPYAVSRYATGALFINMLVSKIDYNKVVPGIEIWDANSKRYLGRATRGIVKDGRHWIRIQVTQ